MTLIDLLRAVEELINLVFFYEYAKKERHEVHTLKLETALYKCAWLE
jgi:hypothetical protein